MTISASPFVECEQIHAGLAVSDIPAAIEFYTKKLGFKVEFTWGDPPTFAGVNLGNGQMFLQKDITLPELRAAWQQGRKELFYPYGKTYVQTLGEQD